MMRRNHYIVNLMKERIEKKIGRNGRSRSWKLAEYENTGNVFLKTSFVVKQKSYNRNMEPKLSYSVHVHNERNIIPLGYFLHNLLLLFRFNI